MNHHSPAATTFLAWICLVSLTTCMAAPKMRHAPTECPLQAGNVINTELFVEDEESCKDLCSRDEECLFYYYYAGSGSTDEKDIDVKFQPAQCFHYDECSRSVQPAGETCPLNRENTVFVRAFVRTQMECEKSCSEDDSCGYYKYFPSDDDKQPLMCYHLKSCSPRIIRKEECPIEVNNYIDHMLFTRSQEDCLQKCEDTAGCRFYYWYPIDYSPAPLYCYLFRSCEGGADEPTLAVVAAGRHPGYYFLDQKESLDVIRPGAVCEKMIEPNNTAVGRAGAASTYVYKHMLVCGGKDHSGDVRADCLAFMPRTNEWIAHSQMQSAREEAAGVVLQGDMYVLGGIVDKELSGSTELTSLLDSNSDDDDDSDRETEWVEGPDLEEPRARFCAVSLSDSKVAIIGGETLDEMASAEVKFYDLEDEGAGWVTQPGMRQIRKDHACIMTEINNERGILVSGGVDETDALLGSVEFYSLDTESWRDMANLKHPRTEHGMALVSGMPTAIGGVSDKEFLRSVEVLDNSSDDGSPDGLDWRIAAHALTRPRYDFAIADVPISAFPADERNMDMCLDDSVSKSAFAK